MSNRRPPYCFKGRGGAFRSAQQFVSGGRSEHVIGGQQLIKKPIVYSKLTQRTPSSIIHQIN